MFLLYLYLAFCNPINQYFQLPNDSVIQVWQASGLEDVVNAISLGHNVIYSSCWYYDQIRYGVDWIKGYECDPVKNTLGKITMDCLIKKYSFKFGMEFVPAYIRKSSFGDVALM
jgi:hypothetical protein